MRDVLRERILERRALSIVSKADVKQACSFTDYAGDNARLLSMQRAKL